MITDDSTPVNVRQNKAKNGQHNVKYNNMPQTNADEAISATSEVVCDCKCEEPTFPDAPDCVVIK